MMIDTVMRTTATLQPDGVYCSPRCGFKCKLSAFDQATKEADKLAVRMGIGWESRVWENGGWNYSVNKGQHHIHPEREGSALSGGWEVTGYSAWLYGPSTAHSSTQFIERAETPEDALGIATQAARTFVSRMNEELRFLID